MNATVRQAALVCLALHVPPAAAQASFLTEPSFARALAPEQLKRLYLACDQAATTTGLPMADAMGCSIVSEELKRRVFENDFERLMAWWRMHRRDVRERMSIPG